MKRRKLETWFVMVLLVMTGSMSLAAVIHVDPSSPSPDPNDPSSWTTAIHYLQDALAVAQSGDEIWVAEGTYTPDRGQGITRYDEEVSFVLTEGIKLYGGYAGYGAANPDGRDIVAYETVLSADLLGDDNDLPNDINYGENSWHVLTCDGATLEGTVLDGFTIEGGNPRGSFPHGVGGGLMIAYADATGSNGSLQIKDCTFRNNKNSAVWMRRTDTTFTNCVVDNNHAGFGAGIYVFGESDSVFDGCTFSNNVASGMSAGLHIRYSTSDITVANCTFENNTAADLGGGLGMRDGAHATITGCTFTGNHCDTSGGALSMVSSRPIISGCTFTSNDADSGGGAIGFFGTCDAIVDDCYFESNQADGRGGAFYLYTNSKATIQNSTIVGSAAPWGGAARVRGCAGATFKNCDFIDNSAEVATKGGALFIDDAAQEVLIDGCFFLNNDANTAGAINIAASTTVVVNSIFTENNVTEMGGAIHVDSSTADAAIANCTFYGNIAPLGQAISLDSGHTMSSIANNIIWESANAIEDVDGTLAVNHSNVQGGWTGPGTGNINQDPLFIDAANHDFHVSDTSLCVDAGDNTAVPVGIAKDRDGHARIANLVVDMGPYEIAGCGDENHPFPVGDLTADCKVNLDDLAILAVNWLVCTAPECD